MEVNKREPYNQWLGIKFQVASQVSYIEEERNREVIGYELEGEPFEVNGEEEFTQRVNEIRDKNIFAKALAEQENRESYTKKFIIKL